LFEFFNGKEIRISTRSEDLEEITRTVLNYPISCILRQKGFSAIHSSAIRFKNKTILFAGSSGSAKSSLAALFLSNGAKLITEDISCFDHLDGNAFIFSSYPWIKLSKDLNESLKLFKDKGTSFPRESLKRRGYIAKDLFTDNITKIDFIFFPKWSKKLSIKELNQKKSLKYLLGSSFGFFDSATEINKSDFSNYLNLIKNTKMFKLDHIKCFDELDSTFQKVKEIIDQNILISSNNSD